MSAQITQLDATELIASWEKQWRDIDSRVARAGGDSDHNLARGLQLRECITELKEKAGLSTKANEESVPSTTDSPK